MTVDRLAAYRDKRDFSTTSEPQGSSAPSADGHRFVVQRHRASSLHYDFRLEAAGVLLSWAVPKGPTLDPDVRRLAMHVEDHPLEYFDFEGVIPAGEYGGGDVIVWDWGTWQLTDADDAVAAVEAGDLHFDLDGIKLSGHFALVRRGKAGTRGQWLLIHKHDDLAVSGWDPEDYPRSVKSGRTNDDVAAAPAATWSSDVIWAATADEIAALDGFGRAGTLVVGGLEVQLTDLDDVLVPATDDRAPLTRRDLVRHSLAAAPAILPYLADRPCGLHRFPDGIDGEGTWEPIATTDDPPWLTRWNDETADKDAAPHPVLGSPAALAWAAGLGAIELRPWTSTVREPRRPTWAVIDIESGDTATFDDVLVVARLHRAALDHLEVEARPMATGRRGLQIWVPVADGSTFDETTAWIEQLTRLVATTVPELVTSDQDQDARPGGVVVGAARHAIAPFSPRAAPGAPVSVPLAWDELDDPDLLPDRWGVADVAERLDDAGDPLAPLIRRQQRLVLLD